MISYVKSHYIVVFEYCEIIANTASKINGERGELNFQALYN